MAQIQLKGMSFFAHHGYYVHEQTKGNHFLVDVTIDADIEPAAQEDDLQLTVNYETIYQICAAIMAEHMKLIETVAYQIAHEIKHRFPDLTRIEVVLHKLSPELGGPVEAANVRYVIDRKTV